MMIALLLAVAPVQGSANEIWDRLKFDAEGRMRAEATFDNVDASNGNSLDDRFRGRMRFRIGAKYNLAEGVDLVGRLSTASDGNDANNPHWDFGDGDGFNGGGLVFDRYFLDYMATPEIHARLGKQPHAFAVPPVFGDFLWDSDISPSGLTGVWTPKCCEKVGFDARVAGYVAAESNAEQDPKMLGGQANLKIPLADGSLKVSNALYAWLDNHLMGTIPATSNQGNSSVSEDFTTWETFVAGTFPCGPMDELTGYVQFLSNLRSSDTGFTTGFQLGPTKWQRGNFNAFAAFYTLDGDVLFSPVAQDDTAVAGTGLNDGDGDGTNGLLFGGTYWYRDNIAFKLWVLTSNPSGADDDPIRLRFDMDFRVL